MSAKNDMVLELSAFMEKNGVGKKISDIRQELLCIVGKYNIEAPGTELIIYDQMSNEALLQRYYINMKVRGLSERTMHFYSACLKDWSDRMQNDFLHFNSDDVLYVMAKRQYHDCVTPVTVNNEYRALSAFCTWMLKEGIRQDNPMNRVDKVKAPKRKKEAFTDIEIENMRNLLQTNREKAIFEMLLCTGCRVSELANIKREDVNIDEITVIGKGNKERKVYLNAKAEVYLNNYMNERTDSNPFIFPRMAYSENRFKNIQKYTHSAKKMNEWYKHSDLVHKTEPIEKGTIEIIVRELGRKCGVKAYPHKFRRTFATNALSSGMPVTSVSKMLGHESLDTTSIYLDLKEEEIKNAHKKYVR